MTWHAFPEYRDDVTGARVRMLTADDARDSIFYQTHPMWTPDGRYFVFNSDRSGAMSAHALALATGAIRQVAGDVRGASVLARRSDRLYFQRSREILVTSIGEAFTGTPAVRPVSTLPSFVLDTEGGLTLDANEKVLYTGAVLEEKTRWAVMALHLASGSWRKIVETDFRVGHFQANPHISGVIMFCWETGGDAPQRTWTVNADGTGLRPVYKETYDEWVTHEVWWGPDRIVFTVWPYDDERKSKPHGIVSADFATGVPTVHSQYPAWHCHGSPDGAWVMGDDFDRNLWLVKVATGERRLLTQGHKGEGFSTHPHGSFTPDGRSIVFASSRNGAEDIFLVDLPEWDTITILSC